MEEKVTGNRGMTVQGKWFNQVKELLAQKGISSRQPGVEDEAIRFDWGNGHVLRLGVDGVLTCSLNVDLEELRTLISGDTTEDLSDDELCRVARQELRPFLDRYRSKLRQAGFEEGVESDHDRYAVVFTKPLAGTTPQEAGDVVTWCREVLVTA
jgi:hypothetical protein